MKVVFLHYHLRRGGVTRVIETAVTALEAHGIDCLVISGEEPHPGCSLERVAVVPGLAYREECENLARDSRELAEALLASARAELGGDPDIWHSHNHGLGKNVAYPAAISHLADQGQRFVLQIHDFAEDARPGNYLRQRAVYGDDATAHRRDLYPSAAHLHYAVLNGRDLACLRDASVPADRLHFLPNAVQATPRPAAGATAYPVDGRRLLLYPTRGIRRKNLGEIVLLALMAQEPTLIATTLAPENPQWMTIHDSWKAFADEHDIAVHFDAVGSGGFDFLSLVHQAEAHVTTSVAEGFGLAFLEPWLADKPILGRDLPEITADFRAEGIELDGLYPSLSVPLAWIDRSSLEAKFEEALAESYRAYGREAPEDGVSHALAAASPSEGLVDFGRLDEALQRVVLDRLVHDPAARGALEGAADATDPTPGRTRLDANRTSIGSRYATDAYGERLLSIYRGLLDSPVEALAAGDADRVLDAFLDPARLTLLRTS